MTVQPSLTDLDQRAPERSQRLVDLIRTVIAAAPDQVIGFDQFMQLVLYAPELGYYTAGSPIFGADGDFVTAPESGDLFAGCVARQCAEILACTGGDIVEYGAGSGRLALTVIEHLRRECNADALRYHIVEPSASLRERQRALLQAVLPEDAVRLEWHATHPSAPFDGVVIANEVLDAMPAKRYRVEAGVVHELGVAVSGDGFEWRVHHAAEIPPALTVGLRDRADGYTTETIPGLNAWTQGLADLLRSGVVLICDYGYPRHEYLHASRSQGTLKCHYKHQMHDDPFFLPGLQDLTVAVNFTDLADAAEMAGLTVSGFVTQTRFLLDCGIEALMGAALGGGGARDYQLAQEAKRLLLPGEMGQTCKFIALTKGYEHALSGFTNDQRHRLAGFDEACKA